jgi:hypothetical protein
LRGWQGRERGNGEIASRLASPEFASGRGSIARRIASRAFVEPVGTTFFSLFFIFLPMENEMERLLELLIEVEAKMDYKLFGEGN